LRLYAVDLLVVALLRYGDSQLPFVAQIEAAHAHECLESLLDLAHREKLLLRWLLTLAL